MGRKVKDPEQGPRQIIFYLRPIDHQMIDYLRTKSALSASNVIRLALAHHAEAMGMDIAKLMAEHKENESTPA